MTFGDIIRNEYAGNANPHKVLMFVRHSGRRVVCLSYEGEQVYFEGNDRLTVIGHVDLSGWKALVEQQKGIEDEIPF